MATRLMQSLNTDGYVCVYIYIQYVHTWHACVRVVCTYMHACVIFDELQNHDYEAHAVAEQRWVYVCVCVCVCVHMYVHMSLSLLSFMYVSYVCVHIHVYHLYIHMHTYL